MADLNELQVFAQVAALGSFTRAAAELDMPKSTVSRKVSELEARLGVRLLQRTTRKLSLTEAGHTYFAHAQRVLPHLRETAALFEQGENDFPRRLSEQKAKAVREAIGRIEAASERPDLRRLN